MGTHGTPRPSARAVAASLIGMLVLAVSLATAVSALASPAIARGTRADAAPPILVQWGTKGTGNGQFKSPMGIAVAPSGAVYVADQGNQRVQEFNADGGYVFQWGGVGIGPGQFAGIQRLAVSPDGQVFVCDWSTSRVQRFTAGGTWMNEWVIGRYENPWAVAVDSGGTVYVAERTTCSVKKYTPSGEPLTGWGSEGTGPAQFKDITGIATDRAGHVFTCDAGNSRITEFDAAGAVLAQWPCPGKAGDPGPFAIAVDGAGKVYVLATTIAQQHVVVFAPSGSVLTQWDVAGAGALFDIAVDAAGDVLVVDHQNCWVRVYGPVSAVKDTTPPETTVSGVDGQWHKDDVTLTFTTTDSGGTGLDYAEWRRDDPLSLTGWTAWTRFDQRYPRVVIQALRDHSNDGRNVVEYRSIDKAGHWEATKQVTVLIDTMPPRVVTVLKATAARGHRAVVKFRVTERSSPDIRVEAEVLAAGKVVHEAKSGWLKVKGLNGWSFVCDLKLGTYVTRITAYDRAGNSGSGAGTLIVK